jgi:hypothetical protein
MPPEETHSQENPAQPEEEQWFQEPEELPRRPRRRLTTPLPLALMAVLLIACGFIGGVLVEKGETTSSTSSGSTASLASRFAALRGGLGGSSTGSRSATGAAGSGFTRPTSGTVAYLAGKDLYVTDAEGNTLKVATSAATAVNKTVSSSVRGIHPGETVTIVGATGTNGTVSAESISVGSSGASLAGLFGGSTSGGRGGSSASGSSSGGPALFGNGG